VLGQFGRAGARRHARRSGDAAARRAGEDAGPAGGAVQRGEAPVGGGEEGMIARLTGTVEEKSEDTLVVDVNGVGYRVTMSLITLTRAPREGEKVKLRIQTVVREDA